MVQCTRKNTLPFDIVHTCLNIIHKILSRAHHTPLNPCMNPHTKILPCTHLHKFHKSSLHHHTNLHTKILLHTHLHKLPPDIHHTHIHPRINIHTKILPDTHLQKFPPDAHHKPLSPYKSMHTKLFMHRPFKLTRKYMSQHSFKKNKQATSHFI